MLVGTPCASHVNEGLSQPDIAPLAFASTGMSLYEVDMLHRLSMHCRHALSLAAPLHSLSIAHAQLQLPLETKKKI